MWLRNFLIGWGIKGINGRVIAEYNAKIVGNKKLVKINGCLFLGKNAVLEVHEPVLIDGLVKIHENCMVRASHHNEESSLLLNDGVIIASNCHIDFSGGLVIGAGSCVSMDSIILTHKHKSMKEIGNTESFPLIIGNNVWVGARSIILHNVKSIGDNVVIGAGSVVTKPVPANCMTAGNPAIIKSFGVKIMSLQKNFLKDFEEINKKFEASK